MGCGECGFAPLPCGSTTRYRSRACVVLRFATHTSPPTHKVGVRKWTFLCDSDWEASKASDYKDHGAWAGKNGGPHP